MAHRRMLVDRVLVVAWRMPEHDDVQSISASSPRPRPRSARASLYLSVIGRNGIPQGSVRDEIVGFYHSVLASCDSMHIVIEGSEFEQSIKRSVIASVLLEVTARAGASSWRTRSRASSSPRRRPYAASSRAPRWRRRTRACSISRGAWTRRAESRLLVVL